MRRASLLPFLARRFGCRLVLSMVALLTVCGAAQADAQGGTPRVSPSPRSPDFLFGPPRGSVGIRGGRLFARAGSDLFDFVQDRLTIDRKDFIAPEFGVDLGFAVTPRTEVLFGLDVGRSSTSSEYRDYVDNNRLPVAQDTHLRQINLSGSVKFALTPRGRAVSRLAWIPQTVTPYVGAGGGALWYEFRQEGDFVDFLDRSIFNDTFRSSGWAPSAHAFGGVDVQVWRRLFLTGEARYLWAHGALGRDFSGFDPIDLTGMKVTAGVHYAF